MNTNIIDVLNRESNVNLRVNEVTAIIITGNKTEKSKNSILNP